MAEFDVQLPYRSFVHGSWVESTGTETIALYSAYDDSVVLPALQCANAHDVGVAVESAEKALPVWKTLPLSTRRDIFIRFADLLTENAPKLAYLESIVVGKPTHFAVYEAIHAADSFKYYAGYIDKLGGESFPTDHEGFLRIVRHEPYGLCAAINPFNAPLPAFAMKAAPALAAGNVIVSKVSEFNPLSSLLLGELAIHAGFPPGVLNVVVGTAEAGSALSHHMRIRKISFTGSLNVGRQVQIAAAKSNLKAVSLELGGKSPFLVFQDADLETAVKDATTSLLTLNGQGCILATRVYVHQSLAERFVHKVKTILQAYASNLGKDPQDKQTISSPLAHKGQLKRVLEFLEKAKDEAELILGGHRFGSKGCYVEPTIYYKPKADADIIREEIFGPVVCIDTFVDECDVIAAANDTEFGLGAYVYTKDLDRALRVSSQLEAGTVAVNSISVMESNLPYGGFKSSGIGRENGLAALRAFTQDKAVMIKYGLEVP